MCIAAERDVHKWLWFGSGLMYPYRCHIYICVCPFVCLSLCVFYCSEWWKQDASSGAGPLHSMNSVRVNYVREQLLKHSPSYTYHDPAHADHERVVARSSLPFAEQLKEFRILDAGCGGGLAAEV